MSQSENQYKSTLNLPQTDFPMRAGLANLEPKILASWQGIYAQIRKKFVGKEKFILHDGPPYANGPIHIGHALNKILKDIIVKTKTLQGFDAPYVPGWDCHGLPIEAKVEKEIGKSGIQVDAKTFRKACRDYATSQIESQKKEFKRLGVMGDWDQPYETKDYAIEANIMRYMARLIANGNVIKNEKSLHWCISCQCALAEAELEYDNNFKSSAIDVLFLAENPNKIADLFNIKLKNKADIALVIWTTTPWTIPANQALCLNKDFDYALVEIQANYLKDKNKTPYLIIAKDLLEQCAKRYFACESGESMKVLAQIKGADLELETFIHPLYQRKTPVWLGDHVSLEAGTGCVHTAPAHGVDDFNIGKHYGVEVLKCVDLAGKFNEKASGFENLSVLKANNPIIEALKNANKLMHSEDYQHSYPLCWRHKTPLIFLATPQWFISMDINDLRKNTLKAIKTVNWIPTWGEERIANMIENRPDWCISRQRSWGSPLGLVIHKKTGKIHPKMAEILEKIAEKVEIKGIDAYFDFDLSELIDETKDYQKSTDVLDVWLDSGTTHQTVLKARKELQFPANLYLEGSDQHRGWFHSSILTSVALNNCAPYKQVLTHGFVVDEKGRKMSKSLGNVIEPQSVVNQSGADILRLWVAQSDYSGDLSLSKGIISSISDTYRKIRNTLRFLLANTSDFKAEQHLVDFESMLIFDRWAINAVKQLQEKLINPQSGLYNLYQFNNAIRNINHFCTEDMGAFYLDIIKDRCYTCAKDSLARRSAQSAMYHILQTLVRLISPVLSFTAEEVWQTMGNKSSILLETSYQNLMALEDKSKKSIHLIQQIKRHLAKEIENLRNLKKIGASLQAEVVIYASDAVLAELNPYRDELNYFLIVSKVELKSLKQADSKAIGTGDFKFVLNKSLNQKCVRCWNHSETVGKNEQYSDICSNCVYTLSHQKSPRRFT